VSNTAEFRAHWSVTGQNSRLPDTVVVAIVSTDVTLKKNFDCGAMRIGDRKGLMIISGAFDQIQVFVQMLGGYFLKRFGI
jgi:hypothetical protein